MVSGYEGLPGGVAVSHLAVYDWPAADGVCGGTPHLHLTCSEAYVVTGGRGAVQTLTTSGYEVTPLAPGTVAWFTPGTIHRLVNEDDLRITVLMQNNGLPEAGDAVLTLPPEYLTDPETYAAATRIPVDAPEEEQERVARNRRDLALKGYRAARRLRPRAARRVPPGRRGARTAPAGGVAGALGKGCAFGCRRDRGAVGPAGAGDLSHLADAAVRAEEPSAYGKFGMCGRLDVYKGD